MKILKLKSFLFSLMAIAMVTIFLTSCEKNDIETPNIDTVKISEDEVIITQNQNLSTFESQENNQKDITSYQESFVKLWMIVNERVVNNGNLINAYTSGKTGEELNDALLKDIGYENNTYDDFMDVYSHSLSKYKTSLKAKGLNLNDEDILKESFRKDIAANLIVSRSCTGECWGAYWLQSAGCVGLVAVPWAGLALSAACTAANGYLLLECIDTCNGG